MRTQAIYDLQSAIEHFERGYVRNILVLARWNEDQAAKMLGIPPETLRGKLDHYGLRDVEISRDYPLI